MRGFQTMGECVETWKMRNKSPGQQKVLARERGLKSISRVKVTG